VAHQAQPFLLGLPTKQSFRLLSPTFQFDSIPASLNTNWTEPGTSAGIGILSAVGASAKLPALVKLPLLGHEAREAPVERPASAILLHIISGLDETDFVLPEPVVRPIGDGRSYAPQSQHASPSR